MPRVNIHGSEHPIRKIFSDDFLFTIPRYQRPYAWTTDHASELLSDLLAYMGDGDEEIDEINPYFLGSIVLIKGDTPDSEVVDGQQRLTTLTILLSCLRPYLQSDAAQDMTKYLYEKGDTLAGTSNRYRLTLRDRDAKFFQENIQNEKGVERLDGLNTKELSSSRQNIRSNALHFLSQLEELAEADPSRPLRLAKFIINRCFLVVVWTPDLESAYRIFSVLNDRGLDLSYTDILKAEIIGKIADAKQDEYTKKWEDLEDSLGRDNFQQLFAHIRTIYRKLKPKGTLLAEFRQYVRPTGNPEEFIDDVLLPYGKAFYTIRNESYQSTSDAEGVNHLFGWLNRIDNFDWLPSAILYLSRNENNPAELSRFFADLERLAAGLMILRTNINHRIERYADVLTSIQNDVDLYANTSPLQLTSDERPRIIKTLEGNLYWERSVRYVLLRLDEALSTGDAQYAYPRISIEHVLPQNPPPNSTWVQWFPDPGQREASVHKLSNLVLLNRVKNSQANNYDFPRKKEAYFAGRTGVSPFAITTQVLQESSWTPQVLEQRQHDLIARLSKLWRL